MVYIDGQERGHFDPWGKLKEWLEQNGLVQAFDADPDSILAQYRLFAEAQP